MKSDLTVGIIGCGNIGTKYEGICKGLGFDTLLCDTNKQVEYAEYTSPALLISDII